MNTKTRQIVLHITACLVFLALPLLFSPESLSLRAYLINPPTQRDIIFYTIIIGIFYLNFYLLIPRLYFARRFLVLFGFNLLGFVIAETLPRALITRHNAPGPENAALPDTPPAGSPSPATLPPTNPNTSYDPDLHRRSVFPNEPPPDHAVHGPFAETPPPHPMHHPPGNGYFIDLPQHLFIFLSVIFLALMLRIKLRWDQAEKEKLQAHLSYLKAQVNPHFLFNVLNSIYALSLEGSPRTPGSIIKLSGMMRYAFNEAGREWVSLEEELLYIRNYIELQETRFGETIRLDFHIDALLSNEPTSQSPLFSSSGIASPLHSNPRPGIAPLILIPFIENAFKHGVNAEEDSYIRIGLETNDHSLHLEVFNKKVTVNHAGPPSGTGILNTKKRLQLLYPREHILEISDTATAFLVSLTLKLK